MKIFCFHFPASFNVKNTLRISYIFIKIFLGISDEILDWFYLFTTDFAEPILKNMLAIFMVASLLVQIMAWFYIYITMLTN